MSEMTSCNYCNHQRLLESAKQQKMKITTQSGGMETLGGITAYLHPPNIDISKLNKKQREKYFAAWYMALPGRCEC